MHKRSVREWTSDETTERQNLISASYSVVRESHPEGNENSDQDSDMSYAVKNYIKSK